MKTTRHWKRLRGRWVLKARLPWKDYHVYYRGKSLPIRNILQATSWPDESQAKRALKFMNRYGVKLRWYPYKVKETELFLEVLRNEAI